MTAYKGRAIIVKMKEPGMAASVYFVHTLRVDHQHGASLKTAEWDVYVLGDECRFAQDSQENSEE